MEQLIVGVGFQIGELVNQLLAEGWIVVPGTLSLARADSPGAPPWLAVVVRHPPINSPSERSQQLLRDYHANGRALHDSVR